MRTLNLTSQPSQSFSVRLDEKRFTLRIKEAVGVMLADIDCEGETLIKGTRILAGEPLIPYDRLERGNFILLTENDALPEWRAFGKSQTLVYLSAPEIAELRHG
ncbi:phage baseplate plug family protein [Bartonella sp. LJL80]